MLKYCCVVYTITSIMYISETGDVKASIAVLSIPLPCVVYTITSVMLCIFQRLLSIPLPLLCDVKASIAVLSIPLPLFCIFQRPVMLKLVLLCCLYHYLRFVYFRNW